MDHVVERVQLILFRAQRICVTGDGINIKIETTLAKAPMAPYIKQTAITIETMTPLASIQLTTKYAKSIRAQAQGGEIPLSLVGRPSYLHSSGSKSPIISKIQPCPAFRPFRIPRVNRRHDISRP
jgi:hypothetical protein